MCHNAIRELKHDCSVSCLEFGEHCYSCLVMNLIKEINQDLILHKKKR